MDIVGEILVCEWQAMYEQSGQLNNAPILFMLAYNTQAYRLSDAATCGHNLPASIAMLVKQHLEWHPQTRTAATRGWGRGPYFPS